MRRIACIPSRYSKSAKYGRAENLRGKHRKLISGSTFIDSSDILQDAYSIRCSPQVHGSVRDTIQHAENIITAEINAATDNPLMVDQETLFPVVISMESLLD